MKNFVFLLVLFVFSHAAFPQWYWGSKDGQDTAINLTSRVGVDLDTKTITFGTADPTVVAQNAAQGSIYIGTSATYQKLDNGSSTNWAPMLSSGAGAGTDDCVARWNGTGVFLLQDSIVCITDAGVLSGLTGTSSIVSLTPANPGGGTFDATHNYQVNVTPSNDATNLTQNLLNLTMAYAGPNDINGLSPLNISLGTTNGGDVANINGSRISIDLGDGTNGGTTSNAVISDLYMNVNDGHTVVNTINLSNAGITSDATASLNDVNAYSANINLTGPVANGINAINAGINTQDDSGYISYFNGSGTINGDVLGSINGINISPNINGNLNWYNGFYTNPNFNSNTNGVVGVFAGGSGTGIIDNYIGVQVQPAIANGGQFATGVNASISNDTTSSTQAGSFSVSGDSLNSYGVNVNMSGSASSSIQGIAVDVGSATVTSGGTNRPISIGTNGGTLQLNSFYTIPNSGGFDAGNGLVFLGNVASGTPVTADFVAQSMPFVFNFEDDFAAGPLGLGAVNVGYVSQVSGTPGSVVDSYSLALAAMGVGATSTGGDITNLNGYISKGALNFGGGLDSIGNLYHFKAEQGTITPTNVWGISVEDTNAENYFDKSVIIGGGGTKKVSNADVGLEIASLKAIKLPSLTTTEQNALTALESMFIYNETTQAPTYYNGATWVTLGSGLSGLTPDSGVRVDALGNLETVTQTNGQILIGSTGAKPVVAALTGTANQVVVTNGPGSVTLSTPQDIATGSSPTFTGLTVSGLAASAPVRTGIGGVLTTGATNLATEVTGVLPEANGGTNQSTYTTGDILYASAANTLSKRAIGAAGEVLTVNGSGVPVWTAPGSLTVGAIDTQVKSANGAVISGTSIYMQTADATNPGLVSTGTQTFAGNKTLSGTTNLSALTASLPLKLDGSKNIISAGIDLSSATEVLNVLPLNRGGTNKALTAVAGAPVWTDADSLEVGTAGTTGQALISGGTGAPTWFAPTEGSALFAGTGGILQQDNANFFWDDTNNRLGLGINAALTDTLHVVGSAKVDNIKLDANAITATDTNGNLELQSDGTGDVFYKKGTDVRKKVGSRNPELRQLLNYPSFEESVAEGTCTNCTSTSTATTGNMLGSLHLLMDFVSSTTGNYTVDKTTGWSNAVPGTASCYVRTTRPNVKFYARSNGTDALNIDVANDGNWAKYEIPFICGATSCGYKVAGTTADSTDIEVNECSISLQQTITPVGVIGQWQDYGGAASYTGVGTPTVTKLQYRQVGQNIEVRTSFTTGTVTAVEFRLALPPGYTLASSLGTNVSGGLMQRNSQNALNFTVIGTGGDSYVRVARATNTGNVFTPIIASTDWNSSEISQMFFSFPVNELAASVNTLSVSQQNKVSQINFYNITNCNAGTSSGSYTDLVDTDCTYAAAQKIGTSVVTPTTTGAMALKVTNVPAGKYYVSLGGRLGAASSTTCSFRLYDGTNPIALSYIDSPSGLFQTNDGAGGLVEYTTDQAVVEWKLQGRVVVGSNNCQAGASDDNSGIMITMVPVTGVMTAAIRDVMKTPGVSSMAPVFYSAEISAAGAVSHEIGDFINGSCGVAGTVITCNFNSGVFPTDANCTTTSYTNAARFPNIHSMTTSQVVVGGYDGSGASGPNPFKLMCHGY